MGGPSYFRQEMKVRPFAIAGAVTIAAFSIPALRETAPFYIWYAGGPALTFSLVLIAIARHSLSKLQMTAIVVSSLLAYWAGQAVWALLPALYYFKWGFFLAPGVGAGILLASLVAIAGRRRGWLRPLMVGTLLSFGSIVPWLVPWRLFGIGGERNFFGWGVHVCAWYCLVGPFAVQILTGHHSRRDAGAERSGGFGTDSPEVRSGPDCTAAGIGRSSVT